MATLVLTAVGSAIGGPIGGAIGAAIGQQIDAEIFAPPARQGSRLKELAVQTSSYGTQIPAIFGAMRVAGTVIWSTDLIEQRTKSGGGKGRPSTVNYSYRVSLAVALSSRPLARIGRIWADGNLIRGASGALKVYVQMRVHDGQENQRPDPLLASAEILGECPAHRGIAYVVFEDLQLAEFGNRIPSFTFEIFEREETLPLSALFAEVSDGEINGESAIELSGFAAAGLRVRDAISPLLEICPIELVVRESQLFVRDVAASQEYPVQPVIAVDENARALDRPKQIMPPAANIPGTVSLRYYDAERDYQAGVQQSGAESGGRGEMRLELPAVLNATTAKNLVEAKDNAVRYAREHWTGSVTSSGRPYQSGDHIITPDGRKWQIAEIEVGLGTVEIKAKALPKFGVSRNLVGASGRHVPSADQPIGETRIVVVDAPLLPGGDPNKPALAVFAAGTKAGWKKAALSVEVDGQWTDIGSTAPPATMGVTLNSLGSHPSYLLDVTSELEIELLHDAMAIAVRDTSPLANDAPMFWLNGEFVRVGRVAALGGKKYGLSKFSRGCFVSLLEAREHPVDASIVLLDSASALTLSDVNFNLGQIVQLEAQGLGDIAPVSSSFTVEGIAIKPPSPVHGHAWRNVDGSIDLGWKRRSRLDLGWVDGVDQVQIEEQESYRVVLYVASVVMREWEVAANALHISATELAAMGISQNVAYNFDVFQIGRFAQSNPLNFGLR